MRRYDVIVFDLMGNTILWAINVSLAHAKCEANDARVYYHSRVHIIPARKTILPSATVAA